MSASALPPTIARTGDACLVPGKIPDSGDASAWKRNVDSPGDASPATPPPHANQASHGHANQASHGLSRPPPLAERPAERPWYEEDGHPRRARCSSAGFGWIERLVGVDASRAFGAVAGAVGRECNKDLAEALTGAIRDSLLTPVLDKVFRDTVPYLWFIGGLLASLIVICSAQLVVFLVFLYRTSR